MIFRLLDQHEELRTLSRRLEAIVAGSLADAKDLSQARLRMSVLMRDHLALEETVIYAPLRDDPQGSDIMRQSDQDLIARRGVYSAHVTRWTPQRIAQDWAQYGDQVKILTRGLTERITYEDRVVYPLFHRIFPPASDPG